MKSVAIIGAGITGLTAAFYLRQRGLEVVVYEAGPRAGGVIQSVRRDGFLAECGPNTLLETSQKITRLVVDAGLAARRLDTAPAAGTRYVVRGGRPVAMPESQLGIFTSPLLGARSKLALLREPFVPARRNGPEESIAEFVTRRLDAEFLERLVDALVGGIYAGDPARLSARHAFPRLKALEDEHGSLIRGQFAGARQRRRTGEVARDRAPKFSFDEGLEVLPATLARQLGAALRLQTPISLLAAGADGGWQVTGPAGGRRHDAVIYCGPAHQLPALRIEAGGGLDTAGFADVRHPPVASVVLGFRRADIAHPCAGFGLLIPRREGFRILGTIFSSSLFPNRAPADCCLLTSYVGGERAPGLAGLPPPELARLVQADLQTLLGVRGEPRFQHITLYPRAIPQYNVGYGTFKARWDELETRAPGLFFAGHYRDGVSLGDSIVSGVNITGRVEQYLA